MNFMSKNSLMKEELRLLREELIDLKECQTRYVSLSVTVAAAIFAYLVPGLEGLIQSSSYSSIYFKINPICLIPLVIILPISSIFFHKASTLFRAVGYYQILEHFNMGNNVDSYIGWENSLNLFRKYEKKREVFIKSKYGSIESWRKLSETDKLVYFFTVIFGFDFKSFEKSYSKQQSYWELVYSTFFLISSLCFILTLAPVFIWASHINLTMDIISANFHSNKFSILLIWTFFSASIYFFRNNLKKLYQLERGFHSYDANYILWKSILIDKISIESIDEESNPKNILIHQNRTILYIAVNVFVVVLILLS